MNSHSIALHDFDIGFVKDFSKIIRLANYDFPSIVTHFLLCPLLCSPACTSPSIGLQFHVTRSLLCPQPLAPLAASPSTISPACSFALNPLAALHVTRLQLRPQPACSFTLNPLAALHVTRLQLRPQPLAPLAAITISAYPQPPIKPFEFFPLNSTQLNSCSIVQLFNC